MGEIQIGDELYDDNGSICRVTWKSEIWKNRPVYTVSTDCGDEITVDEDHEWPVMLDRGKTRRSGPYRGRPIKPSIKLKTTKDLAKKRSKRPMIIRAGVLEAPEADLPIDPYVLGLWLGDGTSSGASITKGEIDHPFLRAQIESAGFQTTDRSDPQLFGVLGLDTLLRANGLHQNKHIPKAYLLASPTQRLALLQGLIDTDGTVRPDGQVVFTQKDRDLAEEVQFLARTLGVKATIISGPAMLNGVQHGDCHRVSFYKADACRLPRKLANCRDAARTPNTYLTVTPAGRADTQCIEVDSPNHLFLVGKSMTPTHNPLALDTEILMGDCTYRPLGDIVVGNMVITHQGRARAVTAVHEQGVLPILRITTRAGRVIDAEPDHPFLTKRQPERWTAAAKLRPGHDLFVVGARSADNAGAHVDEDFVELAAYWGAYGSVAHHKVKSKTGVKAGLNPIMWLKRDRAEPLLHLIKRTGRAYSVAPVHGDEGVAMRLLASKNQDLIERIGLDANAAARRVPVEILRAGRKYVLAYLSRLLSERAEVPARYKHPRLLLYARSVPFIHDLQNLLARFGVNAHVTLPDPLFGGRPHLMIATDGLRWLNAIGWTYDGWRAEDIKGLGPHPDYNPDHPAGLALQAVDPIHRIEQADPAPCRCLTVEEDHSFVAGGVAVCNSTYASRLYVVWRMGRNPNLQVIGGGHGQTFVENEFSTKNRELVGSPAFQKVFPGVLIDPTKRAKGQWGIAGTKGQYVAKGVGQGVHGFRANFIVVDDPYSKIEDAESPTIRGKVKTWFLTDIGTRLLPGGKIFVIMTRFHEEDLTGELLELNKLFPSNKKYYHAALPAICYDPDTDLLNRSLGEVLWDFYPLSEFVDKRITLRFQRFALVFQQLADASSEDAITGKFRYYDVLPHRSDAALADARERNQIDPKTGNPQVDRAKYFRRVTLSVDTATKNTERADWTVIQVWGETYERDHYLFTQKRLKCELPQLITEIERLAIRWNADRILIEDKGNGTSYMQERGGTEGRRRLAPCPVEAIQVDSRQDKWSRFSQAMPTIEDGRVYLPENADWVELFLREVGQFPEGNNDDQVDSLSQYLNWSKSHNTRYGTKKIGSMG